ncbi:Pol Polyprotein, partial [Phytophthora megakarya]
VMKLYCAGSGTLVNLDKSQLVAFHGVVILAQNTPFGVGTSDSVNYLGIPVGPGVDADAVCGSLEAKVCARMCRWGIRARTYRGRLLILNAMVLSVLWHFTPHFDLPVAMIRWLQSLVEQYLLTRRGEVGRRFVKLAKPSICHVSFTSDGLQIPRLTATISTQRVLLLQQHYWMSPAELWKRTSTAVLDTILPRELQLSPFDFLGCQFSQRLHVLPIIVIPTWWQSSWSIYASLSTSGQQRRATTALSKQLYCTLICGTVPIPNFNSSGNQAYGVH